MFKVTTATKKILKLKHRVRGVSGGTSASKTISILLWLIQRAQTGNNELISVVSESFPHLKRGVIRDFLNIMQTHGYFVDKDWNRTDYVYTFHTGSRIEFFSADQPGKVRGPRRDVLFINEANNISYETYTQLEVRTKKVIWLDWNPVSEFWFYTEVKDKPDSDFLILTYKDNEALDSRIVEAIEARKGNKNWWIVYGLGELGDVEGKVYVDWKIIETVPHEARLVRYGLDFGYSNDPAALVAIYEYNDGVILDECLYKKGLSNRQLADIIINLDQAIVVADSAEPKSIDELISYGITTFPSKKGRDSILHGIQLVQDQRISMTQRSLNLIREYRNYLWLVDKDGKTINEPERGFNHLMDGVRYALTNLDMHQDDDFKLPPDPMQQKYGY